MMDKYGTSDNSLKESLLIEESQLMAKMNQYMCSPEKIAAEQQSYQQTQNRLVEVRAKINSMDGKG